VDAKLLGRIQLLDIHGEEAVADRQVNGLARLLVQFLKVGQAESADVELTDSGLANFKASDAKVIHALAAAIQIAGGFQIYEEAVHGAERKARKFSDLLGSESALGLREQLQQAQSALQGGNVVAAFFREA